MPGENLTRIEAQERKTIVSVSNYDVTLDLTKGDEVFGSTTVVTFSAKAGASTFIDAITRTVRTASFSRGSSQAGPSISSPQLHDHSSS